MDLIHKILYLLGKHENWTRGALVCQRAALETLQEIIPIENVLFILARYIIGDWCAWCGFSVISNVIITEMDEYGHTLEKTLEIQVDDHHWGDGFFQQTYISCDGRSAFCPPGHYELWARRCFPFSYTTCPLPRAFRCNFTLKYSDKREIQYMNA